MPPTPFGERLKRERELRGVSLVEVSVATCINTKFLEALENEQWDQLPRGVFTRGFIRTVARYLGLNEDGLISEYALVTNDHPTVNVWVHDLEKQPRKWVPAALILALIVILAAGGWLAVRRWGGIAHVNAKPNNDAAPVASAAEASAQIDAPRSGAASPIDGRKAVVTSTVGRTVRRLRPTTCRMLSTPRRQSSPWMLRLLPRNLNCELEPRGKLACA